jgi:Ni/Co efflux regulator RcnB
MKGGEGCVYQFHLVGGAGSCYHFLITEKIQEDRSMKRILVVTLAALLSAGAVLAATQASAQETQGQRAQEQRKREIELGEKPGVPTPQQDNNSKHQGDNREHHHNGSGAAIGLAAGAAALAIIGNGGHHRYDDEVDQCRHWHYRCREGSDWACGKFDRNC